MSIFDEFNDHGMGNRDAFEELCCQLFETWGRHREQYGEGWIYRNIRGAGGDGGIEAYWHDTICGDWVGLQAKWFPKSLKPTQYRELHKSLEAAMSVRPSMGRYVICIPHDLTSAKLGRGKKRTKGEDESWNDFIKQAKTKYPCLQITLWGESEIFNQLQQPENEGRWRFWFEHSLVNPEAIELSLEKAVGALESRYVPELTDAGGMSHFLDSFFGTRDARLALIEKIDANITLCEQIEFRITSLIEVDDETALGLRDNALACTDALTSFSRRLSELKISLSDEPDHFLDVKPLEVDVAAIESFSSAVYDAKGSYRLSGHLNELDRLLDDLRSAPSPWEIERDARQTLCEPHCVIEGEQGTGKTCGFAKKAQEYQRSQLHVPILIPASSVMDHESWWQAVVNALGIGSGWGESALWQALSSQAALHDVNDDDLCVMSKVAILVDGLDERPPSSFWAEMMRQGDAISRRYPRIRFAYSSRPSGIAFKDRGLTSCSYRLHDGGDVPASRLFDSYIEHYEIDLDGNEQLKWLIRTPMELQMFCTAFRGKKVPANVSTCLTELVEREIERLEEEFAVRNHRDLVEERPLREALLKLARVFLESGRSQLSKRELGEAFAEAGLDAKATTQMTGLLDSYGILCKRQTKGAGAFDRNVAYAVGARHLWDYFMAVLMVEDGFGPGCDLLARQRDAAEMVSILLVEQKGILPLDCKELATAVGDGEAYRLTLFALSNARPDAVAPFKEWVLDEMGSGPNGLSKIVNGLVIRVAELKDHPLGPTLLDKYLRTFGSPAERDSVWSLPPSMRVRGISYQTALYHEREILDSMPRLHPNETSTQMPLVLAWCLSSLSNLKRRHCRSELVEWAISTPGEFTQLFGRFCSIDDPQVREDLFAIAEEVVCRGVVDPADEEEIGRLVLGSLFSDPDRPGNRDAALRFYGRILVERCHSDGLFSEKEVDRCRPPYAIHGDDVLPIFPDACKAEYMDGYWPIHYDLARYVLVDPLASAFGIYRFGPYEKGDNATASPVIAESAYAAGVETPSFDGWVIAAAYQFLLDRGYVPDSIDAGAPDDGHRPDGIDRAILSYFHPADHGARSTVMTVAEKYVWCALREICGYMADRVPVQDRFQYGEQANGINDGGLVTDYGTLLSFDSPLLETTVLRLKEGRKGQEPQFPAPFSCDYSSAPSAEEELRSWITSASADAATVLLDFQPNTDLSVAGDTIPVALYANDWGTCGKESRVWLYAGAMANTEIDKLVGASCACIDGYDSASNFQVGFSTSACYLSPIEILSSPWMEEYDEPSRPEMVAGAHLEARPLSGECVARLIDAGEYFYYFPSKLARALCDISYTDGCRYYDSNRIPRFEYVEFGTPYRHEYKALLADKRTLLDRLSGCGKSLVWYATVERDATSLARERIPGLNDRIDDSWIIWYSKDGEYTSYPVSEREVEKPQPPSNDLIERILSKYRDSKSLADPGKTDS